MSVTGSAASTFGALNPFRYRSYYYDTETGFYYLQSRYYDPETGRLISADSLLDTSTFSGYNLFTYCGNNPISRADYGGAFWDTVLDVVSLGFSIAEVIAKPSDPWAQVGLVADVVSLLIPFATGGGLLVKAFSKVDDAADVVKVVKNTDVACEVVDTAVDAPETVTDIIKTAEKVHANSLKTTKETVGYALRREGTHEIMKFGETTRGLKRYSRGFYKSNGVYMDIMTKGSKYDMHYWQHNQILDYYSQHGHRPPMNKSFW